MDLKNLNISELIRYFLTGFSFILFLVTPLFIEMDYTKFLSFNKDVSTATIITTAFVIGYIIDQLRFYSLFPGYTKIKKEHFDSIANVIEEDKKDIGAYFSFITAFSKDNQTYNLQKKRAEWILAINTSIIFILSLLLWIGLLAWGKITFEWYMCIIFTLNVILSIRLYFTAAYELKKSNKEFLLFCKKNKEKIKEIIKTEKIYKESITNPPQ